ncbi:MAG: ribonuclease D [Coriobacteriia bacterium]|nr:ribonuclease D [Coriobacteriia bacterium]
MKHKLIQRTILYLTQTQELKDFISRAQKHRVLAIDTEFIREKSYYPKLCLIQCGTPDEQVAIDPLLIEDLTPLQDVLLDPQIVKVFHASWQDLELIKQELSVLPAPIFDTQIAAGFLGHAVQMSYQSLVESYAQVSLPKTQSLTDWSQRPLDEQQLIYALDDVKYLPAIYLEMHEELEKLGRLEWVLPEFRALLDPEHYAHDPSLAFRKLKRVSNLNRRQLGLAKCIAAWRELDSQKKNLPRRWILSDELVVELAKRAPLNKQELLKIRGLDKLTTKQHAQILSAVAKGLSIPEEELPKQKIRYHVAKDEESILDLMNAYVRYVADKEKIAAQLLATHEELAKFYLDKCESSLNYGWRYELVGSRLEELLAGKLGLTVMDKQVHLLYK